MLQWGLPGRERPRILWALFKLQNIRKLSFMRTEVKNHTFLKKWSRLGQMLVVQGVQSVYSQGILNELYEATHGQ